MSWAAHEFENYFIQRHVGVKASFLGVVLGTQLSDLFTVIVCWKLFIRRLWLRGEDPPHVERGRGLSAVFSRDHV